MPRLRRLLHLVTLPALTAAFMLASSGAGATTLTFDDVPLNSAGVPDLTLGGGYGGLAWNGSWTVIGSGVTGNYPVPTSVQHPVESAPGSCCVAALFNFFSADFAPYNPAGNPLNTAGKVLLTGWLSGVGIYSSELLLADSGYTHIDANFLGIDMLSVQSFAASSFATGPSAFAMDNFSYSVDSPGASPVPEPGTLLLVGSAAAGAIGRRRAHRRSHQPPGGSDPRCRRGNGLIGTENGPYDSRERPL